MSSLSRRLRRRERPEPPAVLPSLTGTSPSLDVALDRARRWARAARQRGILASGYVVIIDASDPTAVRSTYASRTVLLGADDLSAEQRAALWTRDPDHELRVFLIRPGASGHFPLSRAAEALQTLAEVH